MSTDIQMTLEETVAQRNLRLLKEAKYDELYLLNKKLIYHEARKYTNIIDDLEELVSLSSIAFTKAIQTYDETKQASFSTYLAFLIRNEILMVGRKINTRIKSISYDDLLYEDSQGNQFSYLDTISRDKSVEECYLAKEHIDSIYSIVNTLNPKYRNVVLMHLDGHKQCYIAKSLNMSQAWVSRIIIRSLQTIRLKLKLTQPQLRGDTLMKNELPEQTKVQKEKAVPPKVIKKEAPIQEAATPTQQRGLLLRNFTFETDAFYYTINNESLNNLTVASLTSPETSFQLDKIKTQSLIEDLEELKSYL